MTPKNDEIARAPKPNGAHESADMKLRAQVHAYEEFMKLLAREIARNWRAAHTPLGSREEQDPKQR